MQCIMEDEMPEMGDRCMCD